MSSLRAQHYHFSRKRLENTRAVTFRNSHFRNFRFSTTVTIPSGDGLPDIKWKLWCKSPHLLGKIVSTSIKDYKGTKSTAHVTAIQIEDVGLHESAILINPLPLRPFQSAIEDVSYLCPPRKDSSVKLHMCDEIATCWPTVCVGVGK